MKKILILQSLWTLNYDIMVKKLIIFIILCNLIYVPTALTQSGIGGIIGTLVGHTNVPQVSGRTATFNTVYLGNWPLIVKSDSDGGTSTTPSDDDIIKFDTASGTFHSLDISEANFGAVIQDSKGTYQQSALIIVNTENYV